MLAGLEYPFGMGALIDHIKSEWSVLKGAPMAFIIVLVFAVCLGFTGGMMWRGQEVANAESKASAVEAELHYSDRQLQDIKERLKQAPPSSVDIIGGQKGPDAPKAKQLKDIFSDSGWQVDTGSPTEGDLHNLTLRTKDETSASAVAGALKNAGVDFKAIKAPSATNTTDFVLGANGS
ncbi:hypothetical protein [Ollibium composti]|uniref:LytR/CpsA/Psr regulator C-terminal domain-containing protein n=1 Tax=Ollibium composti TaxID=2675109 RepID=A0ABY2QCT0_9HYPH|nr:hypothetical protein [Mesorhizobium composti]THF58715.1 hypothetical protein E6C48_03390 [Mesorhizobium composti]